MGAKVFREYTDMPINPGTQVDFILAFAIDYTASSDPTDGKFNIFWDSENLSPTAVEAIKSQHENVRVAVSLGGDTVGSAKAQCNAVSSLTEIIKEYHLDGIDIDCEHFGFSDPNTFAECIGQLITQLKQNKVISFASIAPFDDEVVQSHLWKEYGNVIDYVNFQFYAYDSSTTVSQFIEYFDAQESRYSGGKVLTSFTSGGSRGLSPANGFFEACETLKESGKLSGIFAWCADSSGFKYETQAQALLQGS